MGEPTNPAPEARIQDPIRIRRRGRPNNPRRELSQWETLLQMHARQEEATRAQQIAERERATWDLIDGLGEELVGINQHLHCKIFGRLLGSITKYNKNNDFGPIDGPTELKTVQYQHRLAELLLLSGANPNCCYKGSIIWAAFLFSLFRERLLQKVLDHHLRTLETLVHSGANPNLPFKQGYTIWEFYIQRGVEVLHNKTFWFAVLKLLLSYGADPNVWIHDSPFEETIKSNCTAKQFTELTELLKEKRRRLVPLFFEALSWICACGKGRQSTQKTEAVVNRIRKQAQRDSNNRTLPRKGWIPMGHA
ncbi:MAG: hypothetical protein MMC33_010273 [Icmadophila ericetorum]|nr:hypothetical protein [Icmadophila ericetorum]